MKFPWHLLVIYAIIEPLMLYRFHAHIDSSLIGVFVGLSFLILSEIGVAQWWAISRRDDREREIRIVLERNRKILGYMCLFAIVSIYIIVLGVLR